MSIDHKNPPPLLRDKVLELFDYMGQSYKQSAAALADRWDVPVEEMQRTLEELKREKLMTFGIPTLALNKTPLWRKAFNPVPLDWKRPERQ